jgi:hypothetical protein
MAAVAIQLRIQRAVNKLETSIELSKPKITKEPSKKCHECDNATLFRHSNDPVHARFACTYSLKFCRIVTKTMQRKVPRDSGVKA